MLSSVLIANRGEIAVRVARTARRLGMRTIAIYSEADARALHVRMCDEAHPIGPPPAAESYLAIERIIATAKRAGADCIHPGYGFLSENADFATACAAAGIVFVGPPAAAIAAMGLKDRAKVLVAKSGVPVVPGYHGELQDPAFLKRKAYEIGYPVLIKPVAGGGGKGMRRVDLHADFDAALAGAQREARAAFGDPRVLIEKYVQAPRHIEVQVFGDTFGSVIHLNERDCSLQRRHQKVMEEAPAPGMSQAVRAAMGRAAVEAARAIGYVGAGTVEFIADGSKPLAPENFWFMEMNTRLQVEHPVTEMVTGLDLVEWQFRIASGERLPLRQEQVALQGHAVEARVYAEDPATGFLPSTGKVLAFHVPDGDGIRVDTGIEVGSEITPYYDPMIAKVIAHGPTREAAFDRLAGALADTAIAGPRTNVALLAALASASDIRAGTFDTGYIERNLAALGANRQTPDYGAAARGLAHYIEGQRYGRIGPADTDEEEAPSPWDATDGFQLAGRRVVSWSIIVDGERIAAEVTHDAGGMSVTVAGASPASGTVVEEGGAIYILRGGRQTIVSFASDRPDDGVSSAGGSVRAPMHGKVLAILVDKGAKVAKGQRLAIIEAMKMECPITAPIDGTVTDVLAAVDAQVADDALIMTIEPAA